MQVLIELEIYNRLLVNCVKLKHLCILYIQLALSHETYGSVTPIFTALLVKYNCYGSLSVCPD